MKKLFNKIFWPKWELKEVIVGHWNIKNYGGILGDVFLYESEESSIFEIFYSLTRNQWKLKISGRKPKEHPKYICAVERLNQLRNES